MRGSADVTHLLNAENCMNIKLYSRVSEFCILSMYIEHVYRALSLSLYILAQQSHCPCFGPEYDVHLVI